MGTLTCFLSYGEWWVFSLLVHTQLPSSTYWRRFPTLVCILGTCAKNESVVKCGFFSVFILFLRLMCVYISTVCQSIQYWLLQLCREFWSQVILCVLWGILTGSMSLRITFNSMDILTISVLTVYEHRISFQFWGPFSLFHFSSFIVFIVELLLWIFNLFLNTSFGFFFFFFFEPMTNEIDFLLLFYLEFFLLMHKNTT